MVWLQCSPIQITALARRGGDGRPLYLYMYFVCGYHSSPSPSWPIQVTGNPYLSGCPSEIMQRRLSPFSPSFSMVITTDERTIKTPIPKYRLYWCFCFWGGVAILKVLNLVRNRVLNSCRIWSTTQLNTLPPPTPHSHTQFWEGGGGVGEVREKVEGHQFTRGVKNTNMTDCISSL